MVNNGMAQTLLFWIVSLALPPVQEQHWVLVPATGFQEILVLDRFIATRTPVAMCMNHASAATSCTMPPPVVNVRRGSGFARENEGDRGYFTCWA